MANKFYAVRVGREGPAIYRTWAECKQQVYGVRRAVYKSFSTLEEAERFLRGGETQNEKELDENWAVAYVDGSYDKKTKDFSCGAVLFWKGEQTEFSQRFTDPELASMHNVAGEIMGALTVLRYCLEKGIPALEIHHDYEGLGCWADGSWRAAKPGTQRYAAECQEAAKTMKLQFVKVKGHSGDAYNDRADALARKALGL